MSYPDKQIIERHVSEPKFDRLGPVSPATTDVQRLPQISSMCKAIASRLDMQTKLIENLTEQLLPVTRVPVKEAESQTKQDAHVSEAMVPLANTLREFERILCRHNSALDLLHATIEL